MTQAIANGRNGQNGYHVDTEPESSSISASSSNASEYGVEGTNGITNGTGNLTLNGNGNGNIRDRMQRKKSSPMMPSFMVSAPGKVIVFGEHAVVHGKVRSKRLELVECDETDVDASCRQRSRLQSLCAPTSS